jgi:hypothetical protein
MVVTLFGGHGEGLPVVNEGSLAGWPEWLLEAVFVRSKVSEAAQQLSSIPSIHANQGAGVGEPTVKSVGYRLNSLMRKVQNAPRGQRNATLYWVARTIAEMVARGEVGVGAARKGLESACMTNGLWRDPQDGPERCRATIASAFWAVEEAMLRDGDMGAGKVDVVPQRNSPNTNGI